MKNTSHTFLVVAILESTNLYCSFFIVHFSFKQLPCKSVPNPLQIPFRNGRLKGDNGGGMVVRVSLSGNGRCGMPRT